MFNEDSIVVDNTRTLTNIRKLGGWGWVSVRLRAQGLLYSAAGWVDRYSPPAEQLWQLDVSGTLHEAAVRPLDMHAWEIVLQVRRVTRTSVFRRSLVRVGTGGHLSGFLWESGSGTTGGTYHRLSGSPQKQQVRDMHLHRGGSLRNNA